MASDIQLKLGLDATELFQGIDQALSKARSEINNMPGVGDALGKGVPDAKRKLQEFISEQKQVLVNMRLQGNEGSDAYQEIEKAVKEAKQEVNKLDDAVKAVDQNLERSFDGEKLSGFSGVLDGLKGGMSSAFSGGLLGGLAGGLASAGIGTAISAVQGLGTAIFEGAMRADEFGDKLEVAFKQQGIADVEGEINRVRESTLQLANDLGLPTQRTRELAGTVATLGGVSGKQAEDLTKLSAGIETFTDGTVKGEAVVKAFSRGLADPEGAAAIESLSKKYPQLAETLKSSLDPTEKLAAANKILGTSFETVKKQQEDAGGTFNKLSNTVNEAFETIGSGLNNALNTLIPIFATSLGPTFEKLSTTISGFFERIWSVVQPVLALIGGSIVANISYALNMAMTVLDIFYNVLTSIFDGVWKAIEPVVSAFQNLGTIIGEALGFGGKAGESIDFMTEFQNILNTVTGVVSYLGSVISDILGGAISMLFTPLQLVGQAIGAVVGYIVNWIKESGVIDAVIKGVTSTIDFFKNIIDSISNAFNTLVGYVQDVIDFFGVMNGSINEGKGFMDSFYGAVDSVWQIIKNVGQAIYDFGANIVTKYLIDPIKAGIDWIGKIITKITDWVMSFDSVQKAVQIVKNVASGIADFFNNITKYVNIVKINIGGIVYALNEVGKLASEFFGAIGRADFSGAYNVVANSVDRISQAYDTGKSKAQAYLDQQAKMNDTLAKGNELLKEKPVDVRPTKTKEKETDKDNDNDKNKKNQQQQTKDTRTELQKRQADFKDFLDKQQNDRDTEFLNFKGTEEQKSQALKLRLQKDSAEAQKKLNELSRNVKDAEFDPVSITIKPGKNEDIEDVKKFYISEFKKLAETIEKNEIKIPVDLSWREPLINELQEFVKEADANAKDFAKVMAEMFKKPVNTDAQLDKAEQDFDKITGLLYEQNVELTNKINLARSIGDQKAVESLEKIRTTNSEAIADTERRYFRFVTDSKKAISENTVAFQLAKNLELSIQKAFDFEKNRQQREAQEKERQERLAALNEQESDLKNSLAKREISFEEYSVAISDIERQREEQSQSTTDDFLKSLKTAGDEAVASVLKSQSEMFKENAKDMEGNEKIFNEFIGQTLGGFSELVAGGKANLADFGKMAAGAAFDAVAKMIPSFVTGILGSSIVNLGPILGPLAAATLTGTLYGLLGLARTAAGFKDGVVNLDGAGTETSDSIPAWLSKGESVITAKATKQNKTELEWMNKTGLSISDYYRQNIRAESLSVNSDGELIMEVRRLREETRMLGSRISRNTKVEVSGLLSADNRSITALINSERKRNMKRG